MQRLIIAISGASGSMFGIRMLEALQEDSAIETHLIISKAGRMTIAKETTYSISQIQTLANYTHKVENIGASISSGSFKTMGMIVAPCSVKTLNSIRYDVEDNLISRAANVVLKERRKLVLMIRETPLHSGHLENMLKLSNYGAIIAPPVPAFYNNPKTIDELINHSVARVLDLFELETAFVKRWQGMKTSSDFA
jgi:flavin prenyltransferase